MSGLLVHVEGETEEMFVNEVLRRHLIAAGYEHVSARLIGNARQRDRRGGIQGWSVVRRDIGRHLSQDAGCIATTMVDYYGLPRAGDKAWPGRAYRSPLSAAAKGALVESALLSDVVNHMGSTFDQRRFVPFVVVHEFEGLLFSDCRAFARGIGRPDLAEALRGIRDSFDTPEDINDSPTTAPSKRIEVLMPGYQKPLFGNLAALEIGLEAILGACPHFRSWCGELEARARLGAE